MLSLLRIYIATAVATNSNNCCHISSDGRWSLGSTEWQRWERSIIRMFLAHFVAVQQEFASAMVGQGNTGNPCSLLLLLIDLLNVGSVGTKTQGHMKRFFELLVECLELFQVNRRRGHREINTYSFFLLLLCLLFSHSSILWLQQKRSCNKR